MSNAAHICQWPELQGQSEFRIIVNQLISFLLICFTEELTRLITKTSYIRTSRYTCTELATEEHSRTMLFPQGSKYLSHSALTYWIFS